MARKKIEDEILPLNENISEEAMDDVMSDRYAIYAKYVIQDRAIPDARDGLKPVQRRIIYSMYKNGNTFDKPTKKCAKIVGDVMGRFHPHGDTSIYDALVRLSQDWKMEMPLIKFQGNNGSIDNDPAAAYRYTEAKLNEFSEFLIKDIDKDTVEMTLNFDDSEFEPTVLPCRFPNLYVNGSEGIAVAIATDIPPHNLTEMCLATIYRINHPQCELDELLEIVKGPDFPTGGILYKTDGIRDIYATGKGKIELASKVSKKEEKDHNESIITEIPFGVVKQSLVFSIDKIRKSKEIDGIIDVKDLSAGDEIKIVVEVKKEMNLDTVLAYLMNKTQLKISYTSNCVAICQNHPRTLTLPFYLDTYIDHQIDVITRRSQFDLNKAKKRLHIVEGLIKAINVIDEVVKIIRKSKDKADSKLNIIARFSFSEEQAEAIVTMPLYKLSNADVNVYIKEKGDLEDLIKDLSETLSSNAKLRKIIVKDLEAVIKKYGKERKTEIVDYETNKFEVDKRDLIVKEDCYVVITREGYIKRSTLKSYSSSNNALPGIKEGDSLIMNQIANTLDYVLLFTNKGNYICLSVDQILENKYKDEGKHINYLCNLPLEEMIVKSILVKDFTKDVNICIVSKFGQIKKSKLNLFLNERTSKPITCMRLLSDDEVVDVAISNGNSNLLIITKKGYATYFNENELACLGLKASGVKCISTLRESEIKSLITYRKDEKGKMLLLTSEGCERIYDISYSELTARLGKNHSIFKCFVSSPHNLLYVTKIKGKDPIKLNCLMSNNSVLELEFSDFHLTPIESYAKKNIDFDKSLTIKYVYNSLVQVVDSSTIEERSEQDFKIEDYFKEKDTKEIKQEVKEVEHKEEKVSAFEKFGLKKKEKKEKEESDSNYEQISIFDDFGD